MKIDRTVIAPHAAADIYALVDDIAAYPEFLPWCAGASVERDGERVQARLDIGYNGMRASFATRNVHTPSSSIRMALADGPLSKLEGEWRFVDIDDDRCRIEFELEYEFSNRLMALVMGKLFSRVFDNFADQFIARANAQQIRVEIVQASDAGAGARQLRLPQGATVADALAAAALPPSDAVSVFGRLAAPDTRLSSGDRIEINAPLPSPPRQARRRRQ